MADGNITVTVNARADEVEALVAEVERLRAFANAVLEAWPASGIDGDDLQEIAVKHGLLLPETRTAPCRAEGCNCAEYYAADEWAEGITCYRRAACLRDKLHVNSATPTVR